MDREDLAKQLVVDFLYIASIPEGRRFLAALRKEAKADTVSIPLDNNGRVDIYKVLLFQGQRSLITYIDEMLTKDPNKVKQEKAKD